MRVLLTGATGTIGAALAPALVAAGHDVAAATRRPTGYEGPGRAVGFDLDDPTSLGASGDYDAAYYLVHALDRPAFGEVERAQAETFARWWGHGRPLVYLGGLGGADEPTSDHLRSRHEVGEVLAAATDVVELRASIVIGPASASFRLLRSMASLVGRAPLPVPVPAAATTLTQPIAERDVIDYLVAALDLPPGRYDVGGPDVVSFAELLQRCARSIGESLTVWPVVPLGANWFGPIVALLTASDARLATALFGSMSTETVVTDPAIQRLLGRPLRSLDEALAEAHQDAAPTTAAAGSRPSSA